VDLLGAVVVVVMAGGLAVAVGGVAFGAFKRVQAVS